MLLARLQRLPWQLICLLFASVATAIISPSNTTTARPGFIDGTSDMDHAEGDGGKIADLIPLTKQAASAAEGDLFNTDLDNVGNLTAGQIAYISCNPDDYLGWLGSDDLFRRAYEQTNLSGIILYSTATDYCNFTSDNPIMESFAVYTMTKKQDSAMVMDAIKDLPLHMKYFVKVEGRGDSNPGSSGTGGSGGFQAQNPLGPSPSTAVAMIILYSITGIITALFLVIIITGAVRAHRHPERYGPRNVLGRPRQSRARGLGRAILDTIPIVKFGEKEPAKPTDVELGSTAEARDANSANADGEVQTTQTAVGAEATDATPKTTASVTETPQDATRTLSDEHQEGIAPAQPLAAGVAAVTDNSTNDESLGCSICTDDFEKGQDLRVLPCDHKFHPECVDPWLLNVSGTCPLCRVDLRPVTSHDSANSQDPDELAPPLNPEAETSHRRRTALRDILSLRQRPNASAEERIIALRRLREQRRNQSGDVTDGANASSEDVAGRDRRSRGISMRLSDVFTGRRKERREESPAAQPRSDGEPGPDSRAGPSEPRT